MRETFSHLLPGSTPNARAIARKAFGISSTPPSKGSWGATLTAADSSALSVSISSPANAIIGRYQLSLAISSGTSVAVGSYVLLFNPWVKGRKPVQVPIVVRHPPPQYPPGPGGSIEPSGFPVACQRHKGEVGAGGGGSSPTCSHYPVENDGLRLSLPHSLFGLLPSSALLQHLRAVGGRPSQQIPPSLPYDLAPSTGHVL